jgi:hypothetical protein
MFIQRVVVVAALLSALCAGGASAGLRYRFESSVGGRSAMTGRVAVEGKRSRIEIVRGDRLILRDGDVVLSPPGGSLYLLDPAHKTYSVVALDRLIGGLRSAIGADGALEVRILNPRVTVRDLGPAGRMEGYSIRRYAAESSYDVLLTIAGAATKVRVRTSSQIWSTPQLSRDFATFIQEREFKSGFPELDALLEKQSASIPGFPIRQVMSTTIDIQGRVTRITSAVRVSDIEVRNVAASELEVPKGFRKVERKLINVR